MRSRARALRPAPSAPRAAAFLFHVREIWEHTPELQMHLHSSPRAPSKASQRHDEQAGSQLVSDITSFSAGSVFNQDHAPQFKSRRSGALEVLEDDRTGDGDEAEDIYRRSRMNYKAPGRLSIRSFILCDSATDKPPGACQKVLWLGFEATCPRN